MKRLKHFKNSWLWGSRVKHISVISCKFTALNLRVLSFLAIPVLENSGWQKLKLRSRLLRAWETLWAESGKFDCIRFRPAVILLSEHPSPLPKPHFRLPSSPLVLSVAFDSSPFMWLFPALSSMTPNSTSSPNILAISFPSFFWNLIFWNLPPVPWFSPKTVSRNL